MNTIIHYYDFPTDDLARTAHEDLEQFRPMFPTWMESLHVYYEQSKRNTKDTRLMVLLGNEPYKFGELTVCSRWFDDAKEKREESLIHELTHFLSAQMLEYVRKRLIQPTKGRNRELHAHVSEEFRDHVERFTEGIALGFARQLRHVKNMNTLGN